MKAEKSAKAELKGRRKEALTTSLTEGKLKAEYVFSGKEEHPNVELFKWLLTKDNTEKYGHGITPL